MRILSWNILCRAGATAGDIGRLIEAHRPDLVLLQECTPAIDALPERIGGYYVRQAMQGRRHGLAAWSRVPAKVTDVALPRATRIDIPVPVFRLLERRIALVVHLQGAEIANVHLDHGQIANRRQLRHLFKCHPHLNVISGDFNALGSTTLPGFTDAGTRRTTHRAKGLWPLRLDRCLIRGYRRTNVMALPYGESDHRPFLIDIEVAPEKI